MKFNVVVALALPDPSVEIKDRVPVAFGIRETVRVHAPPPETVVLAFPLPPETLRFESASAVPETVMGLVLVDTGPLGKVITGAEGAVISADAVRFTVKENEALMLVSVELSTNVRVIV